MKCRIEWCLRERVRDALYCREHLNDAWANRLPERKPAFPDQSRCEVHRLRWVAREPVEPRQPEWVRRALEQRLPAKDYAA